MQNLNKDQVGYQAPAAILESVLYCDDLETCGHFYEQVVGLRLASSLAGRHRFYRLRGGMLLLFRSGATANDVIKVNDQVIPPHGTTGSGHLAFSIDPESIGSVPERLKSFKILIESEIEWPNGGYSIYCRDPAGNSIEFATAKLWYG
ncbi:VOC family protein [Rhodopirellula sp.]|jgi:catechol 2,3-dioxygenase-like lactoylglutathione lyase family enzyme|nr:VOC family protein [Rhodopirellula sp.]